MAETVNIVRAVPELSFQRYDAFMKELRAEWEDFPRWTTQQYPYPDGTPFFRFIRPDSLTGRQHAVVPVWFCNPIAESLLSIGQSVNSLQRTQNGTQPLADGGVSILFPYFEGRLDKKSTDNGNLVDGEAILTEIAARELVGVNNINVFGLHSFEGLMALMTTGAEVMNITPIPLFVEQAREDRLINERTKFIALDLGSVQGTLHFARLAGVDIQSQIVILDKGARNQDRKTKELKMIYGEIKKGDNAIVIDDSHDSGGSVDTAEAFLKDQGVVSIAEFMVHGIFSYPAHKNVAVREKRGVVKKMYITDSLPQAKFRFEDSNFVEVVPSAKLLAWMTVAHVDFSLKTLMQTEGISDFILQPRDKHEVVNEFLGSM